MEKKVSILITAVGVFLILAIAVILYNRANIHIQPMKSENYRGQLFINSDKNIKKLKLASIFSDNMVLQRDKKILIWGTSIPNSTVDLSIAEQKEKTFADNDGLWTVVFSNLPQGGPYKLVVSSGSENIDLINVYVGDVWYCGGQSNMALSVKKSSSSNQQALTNIGDSDVSFFQVPKKYDLVSYSSMTLDAHWGTVKNDSYQNFSDLCLLFGKSLSHELHVPIGLVDSSYNATYIESWLNKEAVYLSDSYKPYIDKIYSNTNIVDSNTFVRSCGTKMIPGSNYNSMVFPIINYAYKGFIWYQGESNVKISSNYDEFLKRLITLYRGQGVKDQTQEDFYIVQLPSFNEPGNLDSWAILRDKQLKVASSVPKSFLVVNTDLNDPKEIHPPDKLELSNRLTRSVLSNTYGLAQNLYIGRFYSDEVLGSKIKITFDIGEDKITLGKNSDGLQIAGEDLKFYPATAEIFSNNQILVSSKKVSLPLNVRYDWANIAHGFLKLKGSQTPIIPFKTDHIQEQDALNLSSLICQ